MGRYRIITKCYYRAEGSDEDEATEAHNDGGSELIEEVIEEVYPEDAPEDDADGWEPY